MTDRERERERKREKEKKRQEVISGDKRREPEWTWVTFNYNSFFNSMLIQRCPNTVFLALHYKRAREKKRTPYTEYKKRKMSKRDWERIIQNETEQEKVREEGREQKIDWGI